MNARASLGGIGVAAVVLALASLVGSFVTGLADLLFPFYHPQTAGTAVILGAVTVAAARRGTAHAGVWVTAIAGLLMSLDAAGFFAMVWMLHDMPSTVVVLADSLIGPADLPRAAATALLPTVTWLMSLGGFLSIGLLLFPDGRLPSRRWRGAVALASAGILVFTIGYTIASWPTSQIRFGAVDTSTVAGVLMAVGLPMVGVSVLLALASLVIRHHRAGSEVRHQVRWMLYGTGVSTLGLVVLFVVAAARYGVSDPATTRLSTVAYLVAVPMQALSYSIGVFKYRLYDIDVVIRRSLVFGALALFITGVYVAVVVGVGSLIGDRSNTVLAVLATALLAAGFEPVRLRVQRWANVVVHGVRATPYEVLAAMSAPEVAVDNLIADSAPVVAGGLGAEAVVVWGEDATGRRPVSVFPDGLDGGAVAWDVEVPMLHEGRQVGAVSVRVPRGDSLTASGRGLLDDFAGHTSMLMANLLLDRDLERRLVELTASRQRMISAQDAARRRLERDLHDGAQQELVALKVKLGLARSVATREEAPQVADLLESAAAEADLAVDSLRELARGIYPPLLEAEGLATAIAALARKSSLPVAVDIDDIGRHPQQVEAAVYFCVLEALDNTVGHARASSAHLTLAEADGILEFTVTDDGVGFDAAAGSIGVGGMSDRLDSIGGSLEIESSPGRGTSVRGSMPLVEAATSDRTAGLVPA